MCCEISFLSPVPCSSSIPSSLLSTSFCIITIVGQEIRKMSQFKRVDANVPSDCNMILIDQRDVNRRPQFFDVKDALAFKNSIKKNCPCQQGQTKCPVQQGVGKFTKVHYWFDSHAKKVLNWPFQAEYICKGRCAPYRHSHQTYSSRKSTNYNIKRYGEEELLTKWVCGCGCVLVLILELD